jgi:hypothetical protein
MLRWGIRHTADYLVAASGRFFCAVFAIAIHARHDNTRS